MIHRRVRIKMCGMTHASDLDRAVSLGVDAVGFIFYHLSSRYITEDKAKLLMHSIPAFVDTVAVFVNPDPLLVERMIRALPIQYLQFHGEESPAFCEQFARPYIKAVPAVSREIIENAIKEYKGAAALLLDTPGLKHRGGSGVAFDWGIIPDQTSMPIILAGGLNAMNVRSAIEACNPYAVDVCSGIEGAHGVKDHDKMRQFVERVSQRSIGEKNEQV